MPFGPNAINVGYGQSTNNPSGISNEVIPVNPAQTPANFVITGGSIDGTPIGVTTPSTGKFTTLQATSIDLTSPLPIAEGGTAVSTVPANGQLLIGNGTGYTVANLTAGTGMTITNSSGGITLSAPDVGSVTSVSVTTANGVSGTVATPTTTPAISLTLGAITPTSVAASGTVTGSNLSGTNTGNQTITLTGGVTGSGTGSFAATVVTNANLTGGVTSVGNAATVVTNANLTGDVTSVGNATTLTNAPVIAKVLTGYVSGAGTVAATDSILQAIQKLNGNDATNANLTGVITSVGNATSIASQTGTGTKFVVDTSPTLVTPNLGTPSAAVLTSATGLPLTTGVTGTLPVANGGTGITSLGTGVATFLGTPTSANLAAAVTDETGSGSLVFATLPTFGGTGVKLSGSTSGTTTVVSGAAAGTSVLTLPVATDTLVGKATTDTLTNKTLTSPTLTTPVLGTPSSGTLTSCTGLPLSTGVTGNLPVTNLNSGTSASATTFWRGDGVWSTPAGAGTVTSVAATVPSVFSISGSPITSSGTLAITYSGTALPVLNGGTGVTTSTGTTNVVLSGSPTITTPVIAQINDASGNETLKLASIASAVNEVTIENAATGNAVHISATGGDASVGLHLAGKGASGYVNVQDSVDATKRILFNASGGTTNTRTMLSSTQTVDRTLSLPDATDTLVGKATTDTLTNKTITGGILNGTLGSTTPSTIAATTISASGLVSFNATGTNTVGPITGSTIWRVRGGNTNTADGSGVYIDNAATVIGAYGNKSQVLGGAYSATALLYNLNNLEITAGGATTVGTFTSTGLNSTAIGATTPSTGAFTTLSASSTGVVTGTFGVGAAPVSEKMRVQAAAGYNFVVDTNSSSLRISAVNDADSANVPFIIQGSTVTIPNGNVGIGVAATSGTLHVTSAGGAFGDYQLALTRTSVGTTTLRVGGSNELIIAPNGTDRASFTTSGAAITGTLSASTSASVRTGSTSMILRDYTSGSYAAIYSANITASSSNYSLVFDGTDTFLNGVTSSRLVVGGSTIASATSAGLAVTGTLSSSNTFSTFNNSTQELWRSVWDGGNTGGIASPSGRGLYLTTSGTASTQGIFINGTGLVGLNTTSGTYQLEMITNSVGGINIRTTGSSSNTMVRFETSSGLAGYISSSGTSTTYVTSSDYRLKENVITLSGSGEFIDALKPKCGTWKADGSKFVGFLAHEFAEVSPSSVGGEKDAVDENGEPLYQGMQASTSEVIANLVAELQSLRKRLAALESK